MSRTGAQLIKQVSVLLGDYDTRTCSSAGAADGSTLVDTNLREFGTDVLHDRYVRFTGALLGEVRRIDLNSSSTITFTEPATTQVGSGETYEIHRYHPDLKLRALTQARIHAFPSISKLVYDDTLTGDGENSDFAIPSTVRVGPSFAFIEEELSGNHTWNFLTTPDNESTTGWTAASATASTVDLIPGDRLIPKYGSTCIKLAVATATNGTYKQTIANMKNGITAARAAGRTMTYAQWVYCLTASRVALTIQDDSATTTGTAHQGRGWELLTVTRSIVATNATTLTVGVNVTNASGAVTLYVNRGWFKFGDVPVIYPESRSRRIRRDDTTQRIYFDPKNPPPERRNIRLIGQALLSDLGEGAAAQTATMEVDEASSELLAAYAAEILLGWEGLNADDVGEIATRIEQIKADGAHLEKRWAMKLPANKSVRGPWSGRAF